MTALMVSCGLTRARGAAVGATVAWARRLVAPSSDTSVRTAGRREATFMAGDLKLLQAFDEGLIEADVLVAQGLVFVLLRGLKGLLRGGDSVGLRAHFLEDEGLAVNHVERAGVGGDGGV